MSANGTGYVVDDMTTVYSTPVHAPGQIVDIEGQSYRFVKNSDTSTATVNYGVVFVHTDPTSNDWQVAADLSDGILNVCAGVVMAEMATGEYGWVKRKGILLTATIAGTVTAAGGALIVGDTDGSWVGAGVNDVDRLDAICLEVVDTSATDVNIYVDAL